ncbi:MAG: hypothetical protein J3K34DRAFT_178547 [Monoraphidium minutum]|nr:MAG: hypothetical protein J3K34DRAFT_178547 [Monoraphidium minutum]
MLWARPSAPCVGWLPHVTADTCDTLWANPRPPRSSLVEGLPMRPARLPRPIYPISWHPFGPTLAVGPPLSRRIKPQGTPANRPLEGRPAPERSRHVASVALTWDGERLRGAQARRGRVMAAHARWAPPLIAGQALPACLPSFLLPVCPPPSPPPASPSTPGVHPPVLDRLSGRAQARQGAPKPGAQH